MFEVGSLFSGVGGLDLGFENVRWQVEKDGYARKILVRRFPEAELYDDVCTFDPVAAEKVDAIIGGFPCTEISSCHTSSPPPELEGKHSGLWREFVRTLRLVRPRFAVVENVDAIRRRVLGTVLGDLASLGYDAEWGSVSACSVGAPHSRPRMFVVAYSDGNGQSVVPFDGQVEGLQEITRAGRAHWGIPPPGALGMVDGVSSVVDRLRVAGNAVSPFVSRVVRGVVDRIRNRMGD